MDSILPHASSTRWLAESKPVMLMSEAREHSWIFKFKGKERICNAKGLEGNCIWTSRQSQLQLMEFFNVKSYSKISV